ncbi:hypothetical protein RRG08_055772 [Elysia crispata]|uniref:Uncharacterized protein n=1 Tax=Elysia crispata TaxID=231223 RepID=A0AAE1ATG2_9GAST|nr:hypothetical protein RRG08_055772 [Elysia crispata]
MGTASRPGWEQLLSGGCPGSTGEGGRGGRERTGGRRHQYGTVSRPGCGTGLFFGCEQGLVGVPGLIGSEREGEKGEGAGGISDGHSMRPGCEQVFLRWVF